MAAKPRIAHLTGANATIQNSPPLVTSNKARAQYGLPIRREADGSVPRFDILRAQRLAAPAVVYVEQFSAHPLERDAAELYAPPDGYLDKDKRFSKTRTQADDKPVYRIELRPEDGLYPLPYMARQADGGAWEDDCAFPGAPAEKARQAYYPDGSRLFEEIDRLGVGDKGTGNLIASRADIDFFRVLPSGGYTKGLPARERTDVGEGDIAPERLGRDFFPYRPNHLAVSPPRPALAKITNEVQAILASGTYLGAIWTQGSPRVEETVYWFNLLLDTTLPVCGNAAQRTHGEISNDGPKNIVDSVDYITSRVWADRAGRNRAGMVLIQEQQIFAARDVQKGDARPGGYVTTGGHGGLLGAVRHGEPPVLTYLPGTRHSYLSEVNLTRLPASVTGLRGAAVAIKDQLGRLTAGAIARVAIVKDGNYTPDAHDSGPEREVDIIALLEHNARHEGLAGFVVEGQSPYGSMTNAVRHALMRRAVYSGMPVARVGRGNNDGFSPGTPELIGGGNLTATKARLLLMACLMKFGALPAAADPDRPNATEKAAVAAKVAAYQAVFDTH
ncbi:MAG: asparaginase [Alphaproteobacteria bacterium]|nr:asparaginase [Alphaproteobacteria bacterium]